MQAHPSLQFPLRFHQGCLEAQRSNCGRAAHIWREVLNEHLFGLLNGQEQSFPLPPSVPISKDHEHATLSLKKQKNSGSACHALLFGLLGQLVIEGVVVIRKLSSSRRPEKATDRLKETDPQAHAVCFSAGGGGILFFLRKSKQTPKPPKISSTEIRVSRASSAHKSSRQDLCALAVLTKFKVSTFSFLWLRTDRTWRGSQVAELPRHGAVPLLAILGTA